MKLAKSRYTSLLRGHIDSKASVRVVLWIFLALVKIIHVMLATLNVVLLSLETVHESLAKVLADVISWLSLLHLLRVWLWLVLILLRHWLLILLLLLLLLFSWSLAMASTTTTHHSSDSLMSNFTTGTESHTCCHCRHKATSSKAHTAALLWSSCWLSRWGWCWCSASWWTAASSSEESTTTTSAAASSASWRSSSSYTELNLWSQK